MSIEILLADDHQIVCEGLQMLLELHPDLKIVGIAKDGHEAVAMASQLRPNVVVMDVAMPKLNGIEASRQILSELPDVKIVAMSMHADKRYVTRMLAAGVSGYLLKDCAGEELVMAIRMALANKVHLSGEIAGVIVEDYVQRLSPPEASTDFPLSAREREVLQLLAEGQSAQQIARFLHISKKTVESHRRNLMEKLRLDSIAALTRYAIREGIISQ